MQQQHHRAVVHESFPDFYTLLVLELLLYLQHSLIESSSVNSHLYLKLKRHGTVTSKNAKPISSVLQHYLGGKGSSEYTEEISRKHY